MEQVMLGEIQRLAKLASLYEDNVSGKLSDDYFVKMLRRYKNEQKNWQIKSKNFTTRSRSIAVKL